jgi:predicted unusual protein kinase regulating ubiquinone biosynthesis (AarF/ABC1/UbiB family)
MYSVITTDAMCAQPATICACTTTTQNHYLPTLCKHTQELARNYPIGIPSYFGLIIRAFGTLEGLGLSMDPRYSIVKECFPYLARRLLTEDTPRMRKMLKSFLYGKDGTVLQVYGEHL